MWTPNDFYISRDFFNRELINFQVGFVLRADNLWLDPLNKNTLLVTFSVSQQRYTRTTGTITLYISCVFAEEDGSWRKAAQSAAVFPDSICPNLFHQASQPYHIITSHCTQVSAISTYHSERCLDYLWPGVGLLAMTFLDTSSILSTDLTSHELSHLAAIAIGREWVALHVSRQSTDGIHTFIILQCWSSYYVKIDFEGHQHDTERTQIKVEL